MALTFTHIKDRFSHTLHTISGFTEIHTHARNLRHIIESCSWCDRAAKSNLYAGGLAWSDETSCYFTEGGRKSHSHICLRELGEELCACVCVHALRRCTYCLGSLQCCYAFRSSTTAAGWHLASPTGRSSRLRCTTLSVPDTSPHPDVQTLSGSVCLQKAHKFSGMFLVNQNSFFCKHQRNELLKNRLKHLNNKGDRGFFCIAVVLLNFPPCVCWSSVCSVSWSTQDQTSTNSQTRINICFSFVCAPVHIQGALCVYIKRLIAVRFPDHSPTV